MPVAAERIDVSRVTRTTAATHAFHSQPSSAEPGANVLPAISRQIAAVVESDRRRRRGDALKPAQQGRLVAFHLNDQIVAGLAGDFKRFFDSASRRA
jgi:hypothetical protein